MKIGDDGLIGGLSQAAMEWSPEGTEFRGNIDGERSIKMLYPPYVVYYLPSFWRSLKVKQNIVRIEIRRLPIPEDVEPEDKDKILPIMIKFKVNADDDIEEVELYVSCC